MSNPTAIWTIELNVTCPECGERFDIVDNDPEWYTAVEAGQALDGFEATCPKCEHEFKCDLVY